MSVVHTTLFSDTPNDAVIAGTTWTVTIRGPFYTLVPFEYRSVGGGPVELNEEQVGHGALHFQAAHLAGCVAEGLLESPVRPLRETHTTMAAIDAVRAQLGIVFPEETGRIS